MRATNPNLDLRDSDMKAMCRVHFLAFVYSMDEVGAWRNDSD